MSGRVVPFAIMVLLFALLPFLGGSTPHTPTDSVVLAAGSPAGVQDAVAAVGQARNEMSASTASADPTAALAPAPAGSAFSAAMGGGLFMFPAISLAPATAEAIAAPIVGRPMFIHPVPGGETSPFGPRIHPLLGRPMFHTGIDLAAACGTPIHAAADGTVIYARVSASWGGRTIIQHNATTKTAYGHQSKFLVTEGQVVKQGQVIGLSGTTGWSTGCHLHFDVIINDRYVDPAPYLGFPPSNSASVPFAAVPQLVLDPGSAPGSSVIQVVEDGDVPISAASEDSAAPGTPTQLTGPPPTTATSSATSTPTSRPTTTKTSTGTPSTGTPSTGTPRPPTPSATRPTATKTAPSSSAPSTPSATTTTSAAPATTTTPPPPTTTAPSTTVSSPSTSPTPSQAATVTATATQVLATASQVAAASQAASCSATGSTGQAQPSPNPTNSTACTDPGSIGSKP